MAKLEFQLAKNVYDIVRRKTTQSVDLLLQSMASLVVGKVKKEKIKWGVLQFS